MTTSSFDIVTMVVFGALLPFFIWGMVVDAKKNIKKLNEHKEELRARRSAQTTRNAEMHSETQQKITSSAIREMV